MDHLLPESNSKAKSINNNTATTHYPQHQTSDLSKVAKKIDQQSQKDLNNILMANSRTMTLSKSIKDMRLYVSNSFSPSQIVKPPMAASQSNEAAGSGGESSASSTVSSSSASSTDSFNHNHNRVLDEIQQNSQIKQKPPAAPHHNNTQQLIQSNHSLNNNTRDG